MYSGQSHFFFKVMNNSSSFFEVTVSVELTSIEAIQPVELFEVACITIKHVVVIVLRIQRFVERVLQQQRTNLYMTMNTELSVCIGATGRFVTHGRVNTTCVQRCIAISHVCIHVVGHPIVFIIGHSQGQGKSPR